jgi:hypothetical protein
MNDNNQFNNDNIDNNVNNENTENDTDNNYTQNEVNKYYTPDSKCAYVEGKHTYVLNTLLNPSTSYKLTLKK